jgi:arabinan endo-1,5-alpha-L-arabinosidase
MQDGSPQMTLTYGSVTYKGSFIVQADESAAMTKKMTFTATGNNTCVWGSKKSAYVASKDVVDLTNADSQLVYNADSAQGTGETVRLCDTSLLSGVSYYITNKYSSKAIDLTDKNISDGTNVQQWTKTSGSNQEWRIVAEKDGYCKIVSLADESKCIAVEENSATDGLNVELQTYIGSNNQLWKLIQNGTSYGIVSKCSGDSAGLDVYDWSMADGGNVNQWEYWGGDCQRWYIEPAYPMVNSGEYTVRNLNSGLFITENNGNAVQSNAMTWSFTRLDDGTYTVNSGDGRTLTVENGSVNDGANITLEAYSGNDSQRFTIQCNKDGSYTLMSVVSEGNSCADVYEISTENGAKML